METKQIIENVDSFATFSQIDKLSSKQKILLIQKNIVPLMNIRRGSTDNLNGAEIHEKLYRAPNSGKPGENFELFHELATNSEGINKEIASELADEAYYRLQPNVFESDKFDNETFKKVFYGLYGIPREAILAFCIIKYSIRLKHGDNLNYKEIENGALQNYLNLHPKLTNLWKETKAPIQPQKPGWIWFHVYGEKIPE